MANYLLSLLPSPNNGHSIHRLKAVYTDLLRHIDLDNEHLGQRSRIDDDDMECHRTSSRFSFRRSVIPPKNKIDGGNRNNDSIENTDVSITAGNFNEFARKIRDESRDASNIDHFSINSNPYGTNDKVDLATAFRLLAATKSPDKEGENYGAIAIREDSSVCGLKRAKALEMRVVELIKQIGEIVVSSGSDGVHGNYKEGPLSVRTDPVFEYFCEKCILSLFVEIVKEVRKGKNRPLEMSSTTSSQSQSCVSVRGVVWSGSVKAQVYQTVSLLISDAQNQSVIFYILSNNYVNELIKGLLPLQQWTEPALAKMLPSYVDLLKNLTLRIADDPSLFPFLTIENDKSTNDDDLEEPMVGYIEFPLFSAALETATSIHAQSDSQIYATCLAIMVNLMQIPHQPIQSWICQSNTSQSILADHLCERLLDRYKRMTNLTRGPVVNFARHNSIGGQLVGLKDEMGMVHEIFWSGVRGMDVRLCESLLQRVVFVLLKNILQEPPARPFLVVGLIDADVIPEPEANAQVATVFLSYMFCNLIYVPFQRMLSVALFHRKSTPIWLRSNLSTQSTEPSGAYVLMPALSDIVNNEESTETCLNPFRREVFKTLEGEYGEWRATAVACLLQSVLNTNAIDTDAVMMSGIMSRDESASSIDHSIATFLTRSHKPSAITTQALECTAYLGLMILHRNLVNATRDWKKDSMEKYLSKSPVWNALKNARDNFCNQAMTFLDISGVSDIFLDLIEAAIKSKYVARQNESDSTAFICRLSRHGFFQNLNEANLLVRRSRCVGANDLETARFYINMAIHFHALCRAVDQLCFKIAEENVSTSNCAKGTTKIDIVDTADTLIRTIGGLYENPKLGAALDLRGRMFFQFQSAWNPATVQSSLGTMATENYFNDVADAVDLTYHLTLVLDPTDLFIVKPTLSKMEENRGTIMFGISLRDIVAAAVDQAWLHIAIRSVNNTSGPAMALHFESAGTCLIVKQYLDRSREVLRQDLLKKVPDILQHT